MVDSGNVDWAGSRHGFALRSIRGRPGLLGAMPNSKLAGRVPPLPKMTDRTPIHAVGEHPEDQLRFLVEKADAGVRCALVTIVGIVDTASRNLGTHMVVAEDGDYAGSVSSGCIDGSVADFALQSIASGDRRRVQLGAGSNFIDLQLPCGGGVDLLIVPSPDTGVIRRVLAELDERRSCALLITPDSLEFLESTEAAADEECFIVRYRPKLRLILAGRGAELTVFCRLVASCGFSVTAYSPDEVDVESCRSFGAEAIHLANTAVRPELTADRWTAIVTLFHDHDWEPNILLAALASEAFYIGALGSRKTHANRLETLGRLGVDDKAQARVTGPIGLVPSMRNATMLSISTLAEIVDRLNASSG